MNFPVKVRLLTTIFLVSFVGIFLRLFYLQVISAEKYSAAAEKQHFYSLYLPAKRGEIKAADGVPLASNKKSYLLYAHLAKLPPDRLEVAKNVSSILAETVPLIASDSSTVVPEEREKYQKQTKENLETDLVNRMNYPNALWVNLSHFLDGSTKEKIENLKISGLGFTPEEARDYPEASMAAHLLGFVGSDKNGNPKGYFGLEGFYDREISGRPGELRVEKDALGRPIAIGVEQRRDQIDGRTLLTTIDRSVQFFVEKNLLAGISDWKASGGTAIVMDPNNGAILALASFPNYDPAKFPYYPTPRYKNPAVADLYEPGSIIKPLVLAAAINENKVTPQTRCDACGGPRKIYDYFIHTFNDKYNPNLTMTEVLVNSDNTGMVFAGEKLGFPKLYAYFQKYKFGQRSGVDLQEEEEGKLRLEADFYPIDRATMTFGQGISVNALQIMRAWATLANGGFIITPHLVSVIEEGDNKIVLPWPKGEQVLTPATTKTVTEMLVRVANESPTHFPKDRITELAPFKLAVKSGTAQIALGGKYRELGTIASVIGFFPADKPRFLVMVKLNEPEVRPWGSDTAGPVFFQIARDLVQYYGISP